MKKTKQYDNKLTTKTPKDEIISLLYRPTAGAEIPEQYRQTLLAMVANGEVKTTQQQYASSKYDLIIFWRMS